MKHLTTKAVAAKELKIGRATIDKLIDQGLEVYQVPKRKTPLVCVHEIQAFPYVKMKKKILDSKDF